MMEDPVKKEMRLEHEQYIAYLRQLLGTYGGRYVLWRILSNCHIESKVISDPLLTHRQLGQRDVGVDLLADCFTADDSSYMVMRREAVDREKDANARVGVFMEGNEEDG